MLLGLRTYTQLSSEYSEPLEWVSFRASPVVISEASGREKDDGQEMRYDDISEREIRATLALVEILRIELEDRGGSEWCPNEAVGGQEVLWGISERTGRRRRASVALNGAIVGNGAVGRRRQTRSRKVGW